MLTKKENSHRRNADDRILQINVLGIEEESLSSYKYLNYGKEEVIIE